MAQVLLVAWLVIAIGESVSGNFFKRSCSHESCNPAYEPYPNLHASMLGYDVLKGNPFDITRSHDPGYRHFIFLPMIKNAENLYKLHHGVTAKKALSCQVAIKTDEITTVKSYQSKLEEHSSSGTTFSSNMEVDVEVTKGTATARTKVPPIIDAAFSSSKAFKENKDFFTSDKGIIVMSDATCPSYTLEILSYNPPPFNDGFVKALKVLGTAIAGSKSEKDQAALAFFDSFGTHYIKSSVMGARIAITSRYTASEYSQMSKSELVKCNEDKVKVSMVASAAKSSATCTGLSGASSSEVKPSLARTYISSYGSKPKTDIMEWANQKFDEPVPVKMELSPILNLFQDSFMKNLDVDYKGILKFLGKRYWDYCELSKAKLGIEKCEVVQQTGCGWNDKCVRGAQSCINRKDSAGKDVAYCCSSPCQAGPCQNGGTCKDVMDTCTYTCSCRQTYHGATCTERYVVKEILETEVLESMARSASQSNEDYRYTLQTELSRAYPDFSFTVDAYKPVKGGDDHEALYDQGLHLWRTHERNLVVFWARTRNHNPGNINAIRDEVLKRITDTKCNAEWSAKEAYDYAKQHGATGVHVVRWGCALHVALGKHATLDTFRCRRECNVWGSCTDHKSDIVLVFG